MKKITRYFIIGDVSFIILLVLFVFFKVHDLPDEIDWRCKKIEKALKPPIQKEYYTRNECIQLRGHRELPLCFYNSTCPNDWDNWRGNQCYQNWIFLGKHEDNREPYICCNGIYFTP